MYESMNDDEKSLLKAVDSGNREDMESLLKNGIRVDYPVFIKGFRSSLLKNAIAKGNLEIIELLLKYKVQPDGKTEGDPYGIYEDQYFVTSLGLAIIMERIDIAKILLHYGANPNMKTGLRDLKYILGYKPLDAIYGPFFPLDLARRIENKEMIELLLSNGSSLLCKYKEEPIYKNFIEYDFYHRNFLMAEFWINHRAKINNINRDKDLNSTLKYIVDIFSLGLHNSNDEQYEEHVFSLVRLLVGLGAYLNFNVIHSSNPYPTSSMYFYKIKNVIEQSLEQKRQMLELVSKFRLFIN